MLPLLTRLEMQDVLRGGAEAALDLGVTQRQVANTERRRMYCVITQSEDVVIGTMRK